VVVEGGDPPDVDAEMSIACGLEVQGGFWKIADLSGLAPGRVQILS